MGTPLDYDVGVAVETLSAVHRLSPRDYRRMGDAGILDEDARVELIDGLIVEMTPKSLAHENVIAWLHELLVLHVDRRRYVVRSAAPLTIGMSEPEPDITVVERPIEGPDHPRTAALVIEVAVSWQRRDLVEKPPIYAEAAVPEYWVIDLDGRRAIVHTEPEAGGYGRVRQLGESGDLTTALAGVPAIAVRDLLAVAAA